MPVRAVASCSCFMQKLQLVTGKEGGVAHVGGQGWEATENTQQTPFVLAKTPFSNNGC